MNLAVQHQLARALLRLPPPLLRRLSASERAEVDGYRLDPQIQMTLRINRWLGRPPLSAGDPVSARRNLEATREILGKPSPAMESRTDADAAGRPIRIYRPFGATGACLVYFHGGGAVVGGLDTHDLPCHFLAHNSGATVVSVDYALAPERPFPAAPDDALAAYQWVVDNVRELAIDPDRIGVAGDSFGANLATVLCHDAAAGRAPMPALQLLVYPWVDMTMGERSLDTLADGYLLTRDDIAWFRGHYLTDDAQRTDPRASPMHAPSFAGLAPAIVLTAGFDPLRDEGIRYAERLRGAGVPVEERCHGGLVHGFASMVAMVDAARRAMAEACALVRDRLD